MHLQMLVLHFTIYYPPFGCKDTTQKIFFIHYLSNVEQYKTFILASCKYHHEYHILNFICPFLPDQLETTAHKDPPTLQIHFILIIIRHAYTHTQKESNKKRAYAAYGAAMQYKWCRINPFHPLSSTQARWHETDEPKLWVNSIVWNP